MFLVDDHSVFRSGVKAELGSAVEIVGEAGTVADAVTGITETRPDVVLLDVHMPDGGGLADDLHRRTELGLHARSEHRVVINQKHLNHAS